MGKIFSTYEALTSEHYKATGREDGSVLIEKTHGPHDEASGRGGVISVKEARALAFVFQDQKDIDLGRWRSELRSWMVVYPDEDNPDHWVNVLNERTGFSRMVSRHETKMLEDDFDYTAEFYFRAHPLRGEWQDAEHGEVWELRFANGETSAFTMDRRDPEVHPDGVFRNLDTYLGGSSDFIVSAKKLYPKE